MVATVTMVTDQLTCPLVCKVRKSIEHQGKLFILFSTFLCLFVTLEPISIQRKNIKLPTVSV